MNALVATRRTTATSCTASPHRPSAPGISPAMNRNGTPTAKDVIAIRRKKVSHTRSRSAVGSTVSSGGVVLKTRRLGAGRIAARGCSASTAGLLAVAAGRARQLRGQRTLAGRGGRDLLGGDGHRTAALGDVLDG